MVRPVPAHAPLPLAALPVGVACGVHILISDIDDTLTTHGRLTAAAYSALERLKVAGLRVLITTGRPAAWCDHIARMWPVDGVVGENGAVFFWFDGAARRMRQLHAQSPAELEADRQRKAAVCARILAEVPGTALASDQPFRICDLAIDFAEDVPALPAADIQRIVDVMQAAGMTAKVSSIHVNGWFGQHDKLSMTRRCLREVFALELDAMLDHTVYVGDSPNDAPMFAHLPLSVGVANVLPHLSQMSAHPRYVTRAASGAGFVELAQHLLLHRLPTAN